MGPVQALTGSLIMGGGIAGMHYVGMAAMRLAAVTRFVPLLVVLSIGLAIVFSGAALLLAFDLREETKGTVLRKIGSALVMGTAVAAMHYTGMAAARFVPSTAAPNLSHTVSISALGNNGIVIVTFLILGAAILTSSVDRQTQAKILRLNENLEQRVVERTRQLAAANEEMGEEMIERQRAEEALMEAQADLARVTRALAMGELVVTIAHEVNQPLTAIGTYAGYCLRQMTGDAPDLQKLRGTIEQIADESTRAGAVISRIRGLLMKGTPERVKLDINQVVQEVAGLLRNELARSRVSLQIDLAPDLPQILGDRVQLQQVLINLVKNSIEAMRSFWPRDLLIKSAKNHDEVLIQVQDSGGGLDPQQAEHIFEPFFHH